MLGAAKVATMEKFWTWEKLYGVDAGGDVYLGVDRCLDFEKDIWSELGNSMWKKHWSVLQYHVKQNHNDIVKPFRVGILHQSERIREMHDLEMKLPAALTKGVGIKKSSWDVQNKIIDRDIIRVTTKYGQTISMQYESEDNHQDYILITSE